MAKAKKKPRTAAQKAATRKMIAANKAKKAAGKAKSRVGGKRKAKASSSSSSAHKTVVHHMHAPAKRGGGKARKAMSRAKLGMKSALDMMKGGLVGGAGALGADIAMGYLPLPEQLKTGIGNTATRLALGIGAGVAVEKLSKGKISGRDVAVGVIATTVRDAVKPVIQQKAPNLKLGEVASLGELFDDGDAATLSQLAELIDEDMASGNTYEMSEIGEEFEENGVSGLAGDLAVFR